LKLIVIAHPDKNSFTHEITKTISLRYAKNGTVYKVIDLYRTDLKQDYLYFKDILNIDHLSSREKIQGLIRESDEIILIFPIWW